MFQVPVNVDDVGGFRLEHDGLAPHAVAGDKLSVSCRTWSVSRSNRSVLLLRI